jgi:hypothetical protein
VLVSYGREEDARQLGRGWQRRRTARPSERSAADRPDTSRRGAPGLEETVLGGVRALPGRIGAHLRLAWPVFVVFLTQRLLTIAFLYRAAGDLGLLTTRWDAGWYLRLAQGGYVYPNIAPDGRVHASNLAYFPLFPWLVRRVGDVGVLSMSQALIVVSWIGGLLAVWAIFAVGHALFGRWAGIGLAAVWGMAPASLALTMGYPEGMFTAAAAATLYCLMTRRPVWAGGCAAVAGLLRPSAVAVVAMVGVYVLVQVGRWLARRRSRPDGPSMSVAAAAPSGESEPVEVPLPRALLGGVIATLGLGGYLVYVGIRTGEVFGYFTVQAQWGQSSAGFTEYWQAIGQGLLGAEPGSLVGVNIVVCLGYLLLFCLIVFDRKLVWAGVYAAGILLISLTHTTFQHVYARQLLPAFVLFIPLVRMRVPRVGAIAALTVGSVLMAWGSSQFLLTPTAGL